MKLQYFPSTGFKLNSKDLNWGEDRNSIRAKLSNQHTEDDRVIDLADLFDGDSSHNLEQRRDVYEDIDNEENFFFLNYDSDDNLSEVEVHGGMTIQVNDVELVFEEKLDKFIDLLKSYGEEYSEIEKGNYFYQNLKMAIANSESMGGDGVRFSYFYSAKDVEHLLDDE